MRGSFKKPLKNHYFLGVWFQMLPEVCTTFGLTKFVEKQAWGKCENTTEKGKNKPPKKK
jgi:hypothetical protein